MADTNGWNEYQKLVLAELQRHNETLESLSGQLTDLRVTIGGLPDMIQRVLKVEADTRKQAVEIAGLKVRASMWGAAAGALAAVGAIVADLLK